LSKISLIKRIDATKLHPRTLAPLAGPEVNIPFGALVESISTDHDRVKFLFLGEPYSVRREVFLDAIGPDAAARATDAPAAAPEAVPAENGRAAAGAAPVSAQPLATAPAERGRSTAPTAKSEPAANEAKLRFERLDASGYTVARAKVPGCWLVACGTGVTFYPDPAHEWDGASLE